MNPFHRATLSVVILLIGAGLSGFGCRSDDRSAQPAGHPTFQLVSDTVVDAKAFSFETGRWGTAINGQTFQQEAIVTSRGWQYTTYFADDGILAVARRKLPDGAWQTLRFPDYALKKPYHNDVHNVSVIGICETDGTIHLSFDHHNHPLRYRRSVIGLATDPEKFAWTKDLFGPIVDELQAGMPLKNVTYPLFVPVPAIPAKTGTPAFPARLQMLYRTGGSGDGDWHLSDYDPATGTWTNLGVVLSGKGSYQGSDSRCAYPNSPRYGPDGRLHLTWCWRETPDLATNHDLSYAFSDDQGRTWKNQVGQVIARLTPSQGETPSSITVESPGIRFTEIPFGWGQMNQLSQFVDSRGRLHVMSWRQPPEAKEPSQDLNTWRYVHQWLDGQQNWRSVTLPMVGRKPQVLVDRRGTAYVLYREAKNADYHVAEVGGRLCVAAATDASGYQDWKIIWQSDDRFIGEPLFDLKRFARDEVLAIYAQQEPQAPGKNSPLRVIELRLGR